MTTAATVPITRDELEGDEAWETLRVSARRHLLRDTLARFRAADGFSHSRALAFQFALTLLPALIAVVGVAEVVDEDRLRNVVQETINQVAPGAVGSLLTQALRQGSTAAHETGELAVAGGLMAALISGTTAMAQVERAANRIYGVERDRPLLRKYAVAVLLCCSAGVLALSAFVVLVGGTAVREAIGLGRTFDTLWGIGRWPLGLLLVVTAISLLFEQSPRRTQPEASWLAFGAAVSTALWLVFMGGLKLFVEVSNNFGATYGPLAGTIGVLLWTFLSSLALFLGLAFAAQLEAVRAGVPEPRVDREENHPG